MWREGFDLALVAWALNALALMFGGALGFRALLDPHWAAKFVRLKADDQGGGFAEFRATFGGLFLFAHGVGLFFTAKYVLDGSMVIGIFAAGAAAVLSAAWFGAAVGRALSMLRDKTRTRFNLYSMGVEFALGVAIGSPWAVWSFVPPG